MAVEAEGAAQCDGAAQGGWVSLRTARRVTFIGLVAATILVQTATLVWILSLRAFGLLEGAMVLAYVVSITWVAIVFWNAVLGFIVMWTRDPVASRAALRAWRSTTAIRSRCAVVMTVRNEEGAAVVARLEETKQSADGTGMGNHFDYFLLSDSNDPMAIASEEAAFEEWRSRLAPSERQRVTYRRRTENIGYKPGNVRDFCARWGDGYEFMVLLDADSVMAGDALVGLVRVMEARPRLGILQSQMVGALPPSLFARLFEFGHRHGLRCSIVGAAWWQDDRCQFWGHNAVVRLAPYKQHCEMPYLPGKGPFSGHVMCHDQIEASFMHRAGYEVRTLPEESASYEGLPPTLVDFNRRFHRWCQGDLKNLRVIPSPGLSTISRYHLAAVAHRFIAWPALVSFAALAALDVVLWPESLPFPGAAALALYIAWVAMYFTPRFLGTATALLRAPRDYGGGMRLMAGAAVEVLFTLLIVPVTMVSTTVFVAGLLLGHSMKWEVQPRDGYRLSWRDAVRILWFETAFGAVLAGVVAFAHPAAALWFAPLCLGLLVAVPLALLTSSPGAEATFRRLGLCVLPEELRMPAELRRLAA